MSEVRGTQTNTLVLSTVSDVEQRGTMLDSFILYTEAVVGHEVHDTQHNSLVFYTVPEPPELPTVDCSFGSSFQPGVLKGQGVCE